jgi:nucleoid-associated protein EbfC
VSSDHDSEELGFGLGDLLSQVQDMQERLVAAQAEAAEMVVEGKAAGGAVVVQITGAMDFRSIKIDPQFVAENDVTMLEDVILAAVRGAMEGVSELNRSAIENSGFEDLAGGLGELDAALGLSGLGHHAAGGSEPAAEEAEDDDAGGGDGD